MRFQEDLCISEVTNDANGNTLSDPSGKSYSWDFGDRLTQAVVPGTNGGTTSFKIRSVWQTHSDVRAARHDKLPLRWRQFAGGG